MPTKAKARSAFKISDRLRSVLEEILVSGEPEDYSGLDNQAIGQILNDFRVVLARLHAVHTSQGRHVGWGQNLDDQVRRLREWQAARDAKASADEDPEIPEDEEADDSSPPARQRKR